MDRGRRKAGLQNDQSFACDYKISSRITLRKIRSKINGEFTHVLLKKHDLSNVYPIGLATNLVYVVER